MDTRSNLNLRLEAALGKVLRALFRVLLRHSMAYTAFEELARRAYVEVAMKDFAIEGKKPSISRASILSGLTRKEVRRLLALPAVSEENPDDGERYNRAARVITGWVRDSEFLGADGEPRPLPIAGQRGFAALVRRHSGDMPVRAVLDELLRVGAVHWQGEQHVALRTRAYIPNAGVPEKMDILGQDVADLVATIDHNIEHGEEDPRFQRKVMYAAIPETELAAFRRVSGAQGQALLERLDRWLQARDNDAHADATTPRRRVGMGIYYFEEPAAPPPQGEEQ
ncbi:DUF6502 family protein [Variovorax sp. OV329]|uniref:DUF6502 family protein n=1 Tax=Variovorax sp. OV329 TaxID=1882825 RepID=UPI0008EE54AE|nr:DUF6502 family protein [Variovorax sp. OV329]SFN03848.1 hypothetical protein SAMN05444747_113137 [Variovorax sp. OV329]